MLAALAAAGVAVSIYLALFELDAITSVWDPVFGEASSRAVLHSSFARSLPVPDALLGAANYAAELVLDLLGDDRRFETRPGLVLLFAVPVAAGVAGSVFLVALQAFVIGHLCALCLVSAAISLAVGALAWREIRAAWTVRGQRSATR